MSTFSSEAEQPVIPADVTEAIFEKTTLGEYGRRLPIGILSGGELRKNFAFRRWTTVQEREIETLKKERKGTSTPDFVIEVLSRMITSLGDYDFNALSPAERRIILQHAFMHDVFALWTWLRIDALGSGVKFKLDCRACGAELHPEADLTENDIKVVEVPSQLLWKYTLRDGIDFGETIEKDLILQPVRWSVLLGDKNRKTAEADLKVSMSVGSIRQAGDGKKTPSKHHLDSLTKYDLEHLQREVDAHSPGFDMEFSVECDKCGKKNEFGLDWTYDFFFTASSL